MGFSELGLSSILCDTITSLGYHSPTPVQEQAIPPALRGQDVLACAQTGTGKTAGFLLPLIEILNTSRAKARLPRAIILEPTRELAMQVIENFKAYTSGANLKAALLVGGESLTEQDKTLQRGVDVLIATPGRLLDFLERGKIMLLETKYIVIDEADRMLDMGFIPDVNRLMAMLPKRRQTLLFSATLSDEIRKLADTYLFQPKEITITPKDKTAATIEQHYIAIDPKQKREATRFLLEKFGKDLPSILFCNRKRDISILVSSLKRHGFKAAGLHGDLAQEVRNQTLKEFKEKDIQILVASDVAARGLDVDKLGLVINFDVPINAEDYVHRIGRTGRAGKEGKAFTLVTKLDKKLWSAVETFIGQSISIFELPREEKEVKKAAEKPRAFPKKEIEKNEDHPLPSKRKYSSPSIHHNDEKVLGFGEFIPAFMLKAVVLLDLSKEQHP
ncbi:MAG: DEAD/DEAH box helicase [Alphaproteobacteria bacterium]|nr:DEAD/DEAH box helicase [Alphaproteobacteria bacterium]